MTADELRKFIEQNAQDFIRFKTTVLKEQVANDPIKKAELIKDTIQTIAVIPDPIMRSVYLKECSTLIDVDEQTLAREMGKIRRKKRNDEQKKETAELEETLESALPANQPEQAAEIEMALKERDIIRILLKHGRKEISIDIENDEGLLQREKVNLDEFVIHELQQDGITFEHELYAFIFNEYIQLLNDEKNPSEKDFLHHENHEISEGVIDILSERYELGNWEAKNIFISLEEDHLLHSIEKYLYYFKLFKVIKMIEDHKHLFKETEEEIDMEKYQRKMGLDNAKKELKKRLGIDTV